MMIFDSMDKNRIITNDFLKTMDQIIEALKAFVTGAVLGGIFMTLKLPIPAPPTFAGIAGVVGIFAGFMMAKKMMG